MTDLAGKVNVSRANAHVRVARLQERGVIERFTITVAPALLGLSVSALISLKMDFYEWRNIWEQIQEMPEVAYQALMTGEFDLIVVVRAPDVETIRDVVLERLSAIPGIRSTTTSMLLDEAGPRVIL